MMDGIEFTITFPSGNTGSFDMDKPLFELLGPEKVGEMVGGFVTDSIRRDLAAVREKELV